MSSCSRMNYPIDLRCDNWTFQSTVRTTWRNDTMKHRANCMIGACLAALAVANVLFCERQLDGACATAECVNASCIKQTNSCLQHDKSMAYCLFHNASSGDGTKNRVPKQFVASRSATCTSNYCNPVMAPALGNACTSNDDYGDSNLRRQICCSNTEDAECTACQ